MTSPDIFHVVAKCSRFPTSDSRISIHAIAQQSPCRGTMLSDPILCFFGIKVCCGPISTIPWHKALR